jgi:hypothetical protein
VGESEHEVFVVFVFEQVFFQFQAIDHAVHDGVQPSQVPYEGTVLGEGNIEAEQSLDAFAYNFNLEFHFIEGGSNVVVVVDAVQVDLQVLDDDQVVHQSAADNFFNMTMELGVVFAEVGQFFQLVAGLLDDVVKVGVILVVNFHDVVFVDFVQIFDDVFKVIDDLVVNSGFVGVGDFGFQTFNNHFDGVGEFPDPFDEELGVSNFDVADVLKVNSQVVGDHGDLVVQLVQIHSVFALVVDGVHFDLVVLEDVDEIAEDFVDHGLQAFDFAVLPDPYQFLHFGDGVLQADDEDVLEFVDVVEFDDTFEFVDDGLQVEQNGFVNFLVFVHGVEAFEFLDDFPQVEGEIMDAGYKNFLDHYIVGGGVDGLEVHDEVTDEDLELGSKIVVGFVLVDQLSHAHEVHFEVAGYGQESDDEVLQDVEFIIGDFVFGLPHHGVFVHDFGELADGKLDVVLQFVGVESVFVVQDVFHGHDEFLQVVDEVLVVGVYGFQFLDDLFEFDGVDLDQMEEGVLNDDVV